jgi:hypothetical protein
MKMIGYCLLGVVVAAAGCINANNTRPAQRTPNSTSTTTKAAPPPVTQDQVNENNANAKARVLSEEIARDADSSIQQASFTTSGCSH